MLQFTPAKIVLVVATCLLGLLFAVPNFVSKDQLAAWPSFVPKRQIPLGLDLQGGAHLVLEMDTAKLKTDWIGVVRDDSQKALREAKIAFSANATATNVTYNASTQTQLAETTSGFIAGDAISITGQASSMRRVMLRLIQSALDK